MVCCAGKPRGLAGEVPGKPGADMSPGAETKPIDLGDVGLVAEAPPAKGKKSSSPAKPVDAGAEAAPVAEKTNAAEIDASAPAATMPEVAAGGPSVVAQSSSLAEPDEEEQVAEVEEPAMTFEERKAVFETSFGAEGEGKAEGSEDAKAGQEDEGNGVPCNFDISGLTSHVANLRLGSNIMTGGLGTPRAPPTLGMRASQLTTPTLNMDFGIFGAPSASSSYAQRPLPTATIPSSGAVLRTPSVQLGSMSSAFGMYSTLPTAKAVIVREQPENADTIEVDEAEAAGVDDDEE